MELGCFSVSLTVKNISESQAFYELLGFEVFAGEPSQHFLIMKNGKTNIGLFQDMFPENILTFNPGWNQNAEALDAFTDVRELLQKCQAQGIAIAQESNMEGAGPASFSVVDPDGNTILIDQHVG